MTRRGGKKFIVGKIGRIARAQVSEYSPSLLVAGISYVPDLVAILACDRLPRLIQTFSLFIEKPAVIDASKSAILHPPIAQVCAPVRTMDTHQTELSLVITKQNEFFAHYLYRYRRTTLRRSEEHTSEL